MQTFLPFADLAATARVLDDRRLGKQRVETLQILRALHLDGYGWTHHPAVTMWRGHTAALVAYGVAIVAEWCARGYGDTTVDSIVEFVHPAAPQAWEQLRAAAALPPWFGWEAFHRSHRSALLRKDPDHYRDHFPDTPSDLDYVWPPPPVPAPAPAAVDAWVVRGRRLPRSVALAGAEDEHPWTPLESRSGRIPKRARQVARLVGGMHPGHVVVTPEADTLHVGVITGPYAFRRRAHTRPVRWSGRLHRRTLAFPAALQNPQDVFALRGEPVLLEQAGRGPEAAAAT